MWYLLFVSRVSVHLRLAEAFSAAICLQPGCQCSSRRKYSTKSVLSCKGDLVRRGSQHRAGENREKGRTRWQILGRRAEWRRAGWREHVGRRCRGQDEGPRPSLPISERASAIALT